jgi:hypothetical protein
METQIKLGFGGRFGGGWSLSYGHPKTPLHLYQQIARLGFIYLHAQFADKKE